MGLISAIKKAASFHRNINIGKYMDRWYIIPPEWNLPFCVRLHHIKLVDTRHHHNHPYSFYSIVVKGGYIEEWAESCYLPVVGGQHPFTRLAGSLNHKWLRLHRISRRRYHRIVCMPTEGVWTVIFHPRKPKEYNWGYLVNGNHVDRKDYVRKSSDYV